MTELSVVGESKVPLVSRTRNSILKLGSWMALVAFAGALGYMLSAFLHIFNIVNPLQDGIIGFGSSLIIATPFFLAMAVLHYVVPEDKKFWTNAALVLAAIYSPLRNRIFLPGYVLTRAVTLWTTMGNFGSWSHSGVGIILQKAIVLFIQHGNARTED
jgi:hypothetical protein